MSNFGSLDMILRMLQQPMAAAKPMQPLPPSMQYSTAAARHGVQPGDGSPAAPQLGSLGSKGGTQDLSVGASPAGSVQTPISGSGLLGHISSGAGKGGGIGPSGVG